jgi:hypothetical protein
MHARAGKVTMASSGILPSLVFVQAAMRPDRNRKTTAKKSLVKTTIKSPRGASWNAFPPVLLLFRETLAC